ncbi:unnamed protein product [Peniophora sp. CBMAI 1063]|nr:unnamed protein product [Peniophora sp. CBMAI 1063]
MADIASDDLLAKLKGLYPSNEELTASKDVLKNPWWILTATALTTGNQPEAVPRVFFYVLADLEKAQAALNVTGEQAHDEKLYFARKFRDAIFKCGMVAGYSKAINALVSLNKVIPAHLKDTKPLRNTSESIENHDKHGKEFFKALYGDTAEGVQGLLDEAMPDLGWFCSTIAYGAIYGYLEYIDQLETSYMLVGTLVAGDTPLQITWHLNNARRGGATLEQARAAREIAVEASKAAGVVWKNAIPEVN